MYIFKLYRRIPHLYPVLLVGYTTFAFLYALPVSGEHLAEVTGEVIALSGGAGEETANVTINEGVLDAKLHGKYT